MGPFLKFGIYGVTDEPLILYYDEIRIGDSNSSYNEVTPGSSIGVTNELLPPILRIISQLP